MAVNTPSAQYDVMRSRWKMARDCVGGSHLIKSAGTTYLPALAGHEPSDSSDEYWSYNARALYYNAMGRTVDGLVGMVFRKPPVIELPKAAEEMVADCDLMGRSLEEFTKSILYEDLTVGRGAVLVDHTAPPADARPYMRWYAAEDVLDVVEEVIGGAVVVTQARLRELIDEPDPDVEFEVDEVEQIRVLELVDGWYQQRVFRNGPDETFGDEFELIMPTIDGQRIDFIPLWVIGVEEGGRPSAIRPPPLIDLCEVNLCHYRQEADYRNALHIAGVPTLFISGVQAAAGDVKVGSAEVQFLEQPDAKAYFVSYGAEGAAAIRQSLDDLQQMMAFLGARMLQPEKRAAEAAETAQIHRQGEISVLGSIANSISSRLTRALRFMLRWALMPQFDKARIELSDDFAPTQAPPQLLAEMVKTWQAGAISHETLWAFLQAGELVDPRRTVEEEREIIDEETPEPEVEREELSLEQERLRTEGQRIEVEGRAAGAPGQAAAE